MATIEIGTQPTVPEAPQPETPKPTRIEVVVDEVTIGDMAALDRMASGKAGAFADGIDVLARYVRGADIRTLPLKQLKAIAEAVFEEVSKAASDPN